MTQSKAVCDLRVKPCQSVLSNVGRSTSYEWPAIIWRHPCRNFALVFYEYIGVTAFDRLRSEAETLAENAVGELSPRSRTLAGPGQPWALRLRARSEASLMIAQAAFGVDFG